MTELADKKCDETQLSERSGIFQPLDYSFLNIKNVSDLTVCCPRIIPSSNSVIKKDINEKWVTRTLKINNNQIEDISTLPVVVHELFGDTSNLTWLDISCNNIPSIPNSFSSLKHLKIIYMHGNKIATLQEVIKLRQLPKLTKLTLHGNPIEKEKNIRPNSHCDIIKSIMWLLAKYHDTFSMLKIASYKHLRARNKPLNSVVQILVVNGLHKCEMRELKIQ
ncbi:unnamed protein product [Schistosoma intercalatum]|nr:unnamed protein product [Schistosoma intercalatum]CAH8498413.1 unnamed protein product [Schistosoma intercalatum]